MHTATCLLALMFPAAPTVGALPVAGEPDFPTAASWIWYPERPAVEGAGQTRYLRLVLRLEAEPVEARLRVLADDSVSFRVNGEPAPPAVQSDRAGASYDLTDALTAGANVLAFAVYNSGGPGGLIVLGHVRDVAGTEHPIRSDTRFRASREAPPGWDGPGFDDSAWPAAAVVGGAFSRPWYGHPAFDLMPFIAPDELAAYNRWREHLIALPAGLEAEQPSTARLEYHLGNVSLTLDGIPTPALIYRGTVDPLTQHGRRQIALFRDVGVHVYCAYWPLAQCWPAPGEYDFSQLDDLVRGYLSVDPQARMLLILHLLPPGWWLDANPQEMVRYAAGEDFNSEDDVLRVRRPSYASALWQHDMLDLWVRTIEHLEATPWGKRVIGYQPSYGIYGEWHYFGSWTNQMPDTGPAMTDHFRRWLRQRYATTQQLQEAWGDPDVDFNTVHVPGVAPRVASDALGLRDPARRRAVMDYYQCQQELTGDCILRFCQAAKEATGGRVVCGAFYGYFHLVPPQTQGGHLDLQRLLRSPFIDYFAAPYDYSFRLMGQDGRLRCLPQAFAAAGKVHMVEADTRTHLHPVEEHGRVANVASSVAAIRREVATSLIEPAALWWCDFGADGTGGWYDDPQLIAQVGRMVELAQRRLQRPRKPVAQVAVVCDLESMYLLPDAEAMSTHYQLLETLTTELYHTGTPFDSVLLSQLPELDLSRYRLIIMVDALQIRPSLRAALRELLAGRSVLWLWAPGISDGERLSAELVQDATGFRVRVPDDGLPVAALRALGEDPLTDGLPAVTISTLTEARTEPVPGFADPANWYNPRDDRTMTEQYTAFDWAARNGALRWHFATTCNWTDIHLAAQIPPCDGICLTVHGEGAAVGASLRVVVKDADSNEFVAPRVALSADPQRLVLPLAAFTRAPWRPASQPERPRLPLSGAKLVLDSLSVGEGALVLSELAATWGETTTRLARGYANPAGSRPCLVIEDSDALALGADPHTGAVVLASRGQAPARHVLCTLPHVPRQVLAALMEEAGVLRMVDSEDLVVRADSDLVSVHTAATGSYQVRLPRPATVRDALSGELLGWGDAVTVDLSGPCTTLLELSDP